MSLSGQAHAEPALPMVPSSRSTIVFGLGGQFLTSIGLLKVISPIDRLLLWTSSTSTRFYLNSLESLSPEPDNYNDVPDCFVQQPLYVSEERARVQYLTPPLAEDLQVTGPPRITFYAAIDADDTNFRIDVRDQPSDNTSILPLACASLKASFKALDKNQTTPWEVAHDF